MLSASVHQERKIQGSQEGPWLCTRASSGHLTPSWSCACLTAPWPFTKHQRSRQRTLVLRVKRGRTIHSHTCIHACKHTDMHTREYTGTYAYVYMHAHTHASFWILKSTALTPQGDLPNINRPAALGPKVLTCWPISHPEVLSKH